MIEGRSHPKGTVALLAGLVGSATSAAIFSGYVMVGRGDPAARVLRSFQAASDLGGFAADWAQWADNWPAGYFLLQGAWIRALGLVGIDSMFGVVQGVLWLSVVFWAAALLAAYSTTAEVAGRDWGWLAVAALLSLPLLSELSHNAYGAIYFVTLVLLALRALVAFETSGRLSGLVVAAVLLLVASTIRTEAIVATASLSLVLLVRHGLVKAVSFGVAAGTLTLARALWALLSEQSAADFFQQMPQSLGGRLVDVATLLLYLAVPTGLVLLAWYRIVAPRWAARDPNASTPRTRLAEYAVAVAVGMYGFVFAALLFLPRLGPDSRLLLAPTVCALVALIAMATESAESVWHRARPWLLPWVVVSVALQISLLGVDYLTDAPRPPSEIREAMRWIRDHAAPDDAIAVDHLDWWEQPFLLYSVNSPEALLASSTYIALAPGDGPDATAAEAEIVSERLARQRPRYMVIQGPVASAIGGGGWWTSGRSLLSLAVTPAGDGLGVRLDRGRPPAKADLVMDNTWLRVLEVDWRDGSR